MTWNWQEPGWPDFDTMLRSLRGLSSGFCCRRERFWALYIMLVRPNVTNFELIF